VKGIKVYRYFSDREREKCGVLPCMNLDGADVPSFDVVIFTSVWYAIISAVFKSRLPAGSSTFWYYPFQYWRCHVITLVQTLMEKLC